jgi:hypothetical protein
MSTVFPKPGLSTFLLLGFCFVLTANVLATDTLKKEDRHTGHPYTETIKHTVRGDEEYWRIEQPIVTQRQTNYNGKDDAAIFFKPGDTIRIHADGCVQTAGTGDTWKRYINPSGSNSNRLYHGLIFIPGITNGLQRIADYIDRDLGPVPSNFPVKELYLRLGYEDDNYGDHGGNGYWGHDDGTEDQCKSTKGRYGGPAYVQIRIIHRPSENGKPGPNPPKRIYRPLDLVVDEWDDNLLPKNPKWGWQETTSRTSSYDTSYFFRPEDKCPILGSRGAYSWGPTVDAEEKYGQIYRAMREQNCTIQPVTFDYNHICGSHVNWAPVTYEGSIRWYDHDRWDDDYNFYLETPNGIGSTRGGMGSIKLEFSSDAVIDHFATPWWDAFHKAVDESNEAAQRLLLDGSYAVVTGFMGLDCGHECDAELHPVWALAINVKDDPNDDIWAIFIVTKLQEGMCSQTDHYLPLLVSAGNVNLSLFTFRLPWKFHASSVSVVNARFGEYGIPNIGPDVSYKPNDGVLVTFNVPNSNTVSRINGELHFRWTGASTAQTRALPGGGQTHKAIGSGPLKHTQMTRKVEAEITAEQEFEFLVNEMSPEKRNNFLKKYKQIKLKVISYDNNLPTKSIKSRAISNLPKRIPKQPIPRVRSVYDTQRMQANKQVINALTDSGVLSRNNVSYPLLEYLRQTSPKLLRDEGPASVRPLKPLSPTGAPKNKKLNVIPNSSNIGGH